MLHILYDVEDATFWQKFP